MRDYTDNTYREKGFTNYGHGSRTGEIVIDNSANKPQRVAGAADKLMRNYAYPTVHRQPATSI